MSSHTNRTTRTCRLAGVAALFWVVGPGGCDGQARGPEPEDTVAQGPLFQTQAVAVRLDAPSDGTDLPSLSVLSFRAQAKGIGADDVLAAVDPLLAAAPHGECIIRRVDETAELLRQRRGGVELQAMSNLSVKLPGTGIELRPVPRVYPDLARVVAGVVAEAGPVAIPDSGNVLSELSVAFDSGHGDKVVLPRAPSITRAGGAPLRGPSTKDAAKDRNTDGSVHTTDEGAAAGAISVRDDLDLEISAERGAFIEVRPFGTTSWAACPVVFLPADSNGAATAATLESELPRGRVVIPGAILQKLARESGEVPVSFDVVWRGVRAIGMPGRPVLLSVEVRTSSLVELSP